MTPARWSGLVVVAAAASALAIPAGAQTAGACPAGSATPVFTVNGKAGPAYTTHDLFVRVRLSGGADYIVESYDVQGIRRLPHPDGDESPSNEAFGTADAPGTITAAATLSNEDANCTVSGTASFEVRAATTPEVSNLRRPPRWKRRPSRLWDTRYWFWVKPGPTGDVSPITVEARAVRRARVPGPGVPATRITYPMRPSDGEPPDQEPRRGCAFLTIICPPKARAWPKGAEVEAQGLGGRVVPAAVKARVTLPRGYPAGLRVVKTPIGVDVRVLQGGAVIARLRMAGRCDASGQFSVCRFKTLSTRL